MCDADGEEHVRSVAFCASDEGCQGRYGTTEIKTEELAMVVTVQVQMLVPEFTVINLVPYLLTIPLCGQ